MCGVAAGGSGGAGGRRSGGGDVQAAGGGVQRDAGVTGGLERARARSCAAPKGDGGGAGVSIDYSEETSLYNFATVSYQNTTDMCGN